MKLILYIGTGPYIQDKEKKIKIMKNENTTKEKS